MQSAPSSWRRGTPGGLGPPLRQPRRKVGRFLDELAEDAMSKIKLIHHINVPISNRERTREWYEKVLGAEFLDRGPELNKRQLQLRLGTGEIHFSETPRPAPTPSSHFALEIDDWDGMLAHLDALGVSHVRTSAASVAANMGGTDPYQGRREYSGEHYTYIHDPDGNMIELVHHPLGMEDAHGDKVEFVPNVAGIRWRLQPGLVTSA
jgi:catechol 2,3-dioxygenase-like lactoylglutathione lyase family enzyme